MNPPIQGKSVKHPFAIPRASTRPEISNCQYLMGTLPNFASNLARHFSDINRVVLTLSGGSAKLISSPWWNPWLSIHRTRNRGDLTTLRCVVNVGTTHELACARPVGLTHESLRGLVHGGLFAVDNDARLNEPRPPSTMLLKLQAPELFSTRLVGPTWSAGRLATLSCYLTTRKTAPLMFSVASIL